MAKLFDADGNEIEAMTKEESDAAIAAAVEAAKKADADAAEAAAAEAAENKGADGGADDMPAWAKTLVEKVDTIAGTQTKSTLKDLGQPYTKGDTEQQAEFEKRFNSLTGYGDTPEAQAQRAEDAARLAFPDMKVVDVASIAGTGGGRNLNQAGDKPLASEADKKIQASLGVTPAMIEKHGEAVAKALGE